MASSSPFRHLVPPSSVRPPVTFTECFYRSFRGDAQCLVVVSDFEFDDMMGIILMLARGIPIIIYHYVNSREKKENPHITVNKLKLFNMLFAGPMRDGRITLKTFENQTHPPAVPGVPYELVILAPIEPVGNEAFMRDMDRFPPNIIYFYAGEYNLKHTITSKDNLVSWVQRRHIPFVNVSKFGFCPDHPNPDKAFDYEQLGAFGGTIRQFNAMFNATHMTKDRFILKKDVPKEVAASEAAFDSIDEQLAYIKDDKERQAAFLRYLNEHQKDDARVQAIKDTAGKKASMINISILSCDALAGALVSRILPLSGEEGVLNLVPKPQPDGEVKTFLEVHPHNPEAPEPHYALQAKAPFYALKKVTDYISMYFLSLQES